MSGPSRRVIIPIVVTYNYSSDIFQSGYNNAGDMSVGEEGMGLDGNICLHCWGATYNYYHRENFYDII